MMCVCVFFLCTKFLTPLSNDSFVTALKQKAKETVRVGAMLLPYTVREPTLAGSNSACTSQINAGLLNVQNRRAVESEGVGGGRRAINTVTNIGITNGKVHLQRKKSIRYKQHKICQELKYKITCTNTNTSTNTSRSTNTARYQQTGDYSQSTKHRSNQHLLRDRA